MEQNGVWPRLKKKARLAANKRKTRAAWLIKIDKNQDQTCTVLIKIKEPMGSILCHRWEIKRRESYHSGGSETSIARASVVMRAAAPMVFGEGGWHGWMRRGAARPLVVTTVVEGVGASGVTRPKLG